jgi:allantoate deiminase
VVASLDVRHAEDAIRRGAVAAMVTAAREAGAARGVHVGVVSGSDEDAVPTDTALSDLLREASASAGYTARTMVSGAGHDARVVASRLPIAMLFLRSPKGLSHHPDESVLVEDVEAALATALEFVRMLGQSSSRPSRETDSRGTGHPGICAVPGGEERRGSNREEAHA